MEVIEPESLRLKIKDRIEKNLGLYLQKLPTKKTHPFECVFFICLLLFLVSNPKIISFIYDLFIRRKICSEQCRHDFQKYTDFI